MDQLPYFRPHELQETKVDPSAIPLTVILPTFGADQRCLLGMVHLNCMFRSCGSPWRWAYRLYLYFVPMCKWENPNTQCLERFFWNQKANCGQNRCRNSWQLIYWLINWHDQSIIMKLEYQCACWIIYLYLTDAYLSTSSAGAVVIEHQICCSP